MARITNVTRDELAVGADASFERVVAERDLQLFPHVSGNRNPRMLPDRPGETDGVVAPSVWIASLVAAALRNRLPGPGTYDRAQTLAFHGRAAVGERLRVRVRCIETCERPVARFAPVVACADDGAPLCTGEAEVEVLVERETVDARVLPRLILDEVDQFTPLKALAATLPPLVTAVAAPEDANAPGGALLARERGLIAPVLSGDRAAIARAAAELGKDVAGLPVEAAPSHAAAAQLAAAMVNEAQADAIMKGALHSDELLAAVVRREGGLRGERRITPVFVMDVPKLEEPRFITDAAINISPDLVTKVDIVQNAIELARACGVETPRVGILSAVETVNPAIPSTRDAAVLSRTAERGQIRGGVGDGPLAMDNAMDVTAARTKGITSLVAGCADVLVVPNLEAGTVLARELTFVAKAEAAGVVLGAEAPVMLTSRAGNDRARLASAAVTQLSQHWKRTGRALAADPAAPIPPPAAAIPPSAADAPATAGAAR